MGQFSKHTRYLWHSSQQTQPQASGGGGGNGGYLTAGKLGDGEPTIAIVSESPLEYWTVWGESEDGVKKPFRFSAEPSSATSRQNSVISTTMNYEGTALEAPKFGLSFFCFDYADSKIKVFEITQKTLIKELDKLSQDEDYADIHAWDLKVNRTGLKMNTEYSILPSPRKEGAEEKISKAWADAQNDGYDLQQLLVGGSPFGS